MGVTARCEWCSRRIDNDLPIGRRRRYCTQSCRQRAYEKRRQQSSGTAGPDEATIRRADLESLQDRLYVLRSAIEVLDATLEEQPTRDELISVAREVVSAAGDLDRLWVSP